MHNYTVTLKSPLPYHAPPSHPIFSLPLNPRQFVLPLSPQKTGGSIYHNPVFICKGTQLSVPSHGSASLGPSNGNGAAVHDWKVRSVGIENIDVATLGNLCVDIVLNVPKLPPRSREASFAYMQDLSKSPPDKVCSSFNWFQLFNFLKLLVTKINYIEKHEIGVLYLWPCC
jgi:hypothetical protein